MNIKQWKSRVTDMGCIICGGPAELHHPRFAAGMAQRAPDALVIPLCPNHHRLGGIGTALHAGQVTFEQNHGTEAELLAKTILRAAG